MYFSKSRHQLKIPHTPHVEQHLIENPLIISHIYELCVIFYNTYKFPSNIAQENRQTFIQPQQYCNCHIFQYSD